MKGAAQRGRLILGVLLSHWRRHPANLATLLAGLAVATALWSGVEALNAEARRSYGEAARTFGGGGIVSLTGTFGPRFSQDLYVALRRAGWRVSPVLEGDVQVGAVRLRVLGVEPLTLPREAGLAASALEAVQKSGDIARFIAPPHETLASSETLRLLGLGPGAEPPIEGGAALPPLVVREGLTRGLVVVDIGVAQRLLGAEGRLSRLVLAEDQVTGDGRRPSLDAITGGALRLVKPDEDGDLARLTASFHLNLTAFGFLSFVVGLFIVHGAIGLAFEQRLPGIRTLRAVGVSARALTVAVLIELVVIALIAGAVGMVLGYLIAAALLPNVAASLAGLYGAHVPGSIAIEGRFWLSGLAMALGGTLAAALGALFKTYRMPVLAIAQSFAWFEAARRAQRRQGFAAGVGLLIAGVALVFGDSLAAGFIVIAGLLIGSALLLPRLAGWLLGAGERAAKGPLTQWILADGRQQLSGLSLALMALLVALSANIGVRAMVEGFRQTFTHWLDRRLVAEVYYEAASEQDAAGISTWLGARPEVSAILPVWKAETRFSGAPLELVGFKDHETYRAHFPLMDAASGAWDEVAAGRGVLVSEQLQRRHTLHLGDAIEIAAPKGPLVLRVAGVFSDYGNPKGQLRLALDVLVAAFPDVAKTAFSLRVTPDAVPGLLQALQREFGPRLVRLIDQASLKALSTRIFEQTFAVTAALNVLTLVVAGIALFTSLLTLADARLVSLAPLWAIGVTRRRLASLELIKLVVIAGITALLAIPLGLALAWCLVALVNVQAFGWRLPLYFFPGQWALSFALAILTALLAAIVPAVRLSRISPALLMKVFAHER